MTRPSHRFALLLLLAAFAAEMFLGDVDFGPVSLRVYLYALLLGWMAYRLVIAGDVFPRVGPAALLLTLYAVFVGWSLVAYVIQDVPVAAIAKEVVTYHGIAVASFLLILFIVRNRRDLHLFLGGFVGLVVLSSITAILQAMRFPPAWAIWFRIRPHQVAGTQIGFIVGKAGEEPVMPPGLFAASFTFGYYLAVAAVLLLAFCMLRRSMTRLLALFALCAAVLVVQQRSALLAAVVTCGVFMLMQFERGRRLRMIVTVAIIGLAAFATYTAMRPQEEGADALRRYENFVDVGRVRLAMLCLDFIEEHPFVGGANAYVQFASRNFDIFQEYTTSPHNLFLNAAVFSGVPGLLLISVFLLALGAVLLQAWRLARARRDLLGAAIVLALIGYLINAQFHNASFVSGDTLPWWLVASVLLSVRFAPAADERERRVRKTVLSSRPPIAAPPRLQQGAS